MNAYELADEIDSIAKDWLGQNKSGQLANMLRQQADRIAELEHMNKNWQLSEKMAYNRIAELEKRVVALTMSLNTKAIKVSELERQLKNV